MKPCLACGAAQTRKILDFGPQPAANLLPDAPMQVAKRVTLALRFCDACGHAQQDSFYPPEELFRHYLYQSGTTKTLADFFHWLAAAVARTLGPQCKVLEIASNDGSLLDALIHQGLAATGIEPARNLAAISRARGHVVIEGFWPEVGLPDRFDCIIGLNVLAHGPDPLAFLRHVRANLTESGIALVQVSQADMFKNYEFDTLYHEHYSFFCPSSLDVMARRAGFTRTAFCKTAVHGGSIMALLGFDASPIGDVGAALASGAFAAEALSPAERPSAAVADRFTERASETCRSVAMLGRLAREGGRKVVLVGAAAKAITVLQASGVVIDAVLDEAALKIGRYIPESDLRIAAFADCTGFDEPCLFLIGAWNFRPEIEGKLRAIRARPGDLAAVYFPTLKIAELNPATVPTG